MIVSYDGTDLTVPGYAKSAWVSSELALLATTVGALDTRVGNIETILANNSLSITANEAKIIKNAGLISGQATADSTLQTNIDNIALTPGQKGQTGSEGAKGTHTVGEKGDAGSKGQTGGEGAKGTHTVGEKGDAGVDGSKGDAGSNGSKGQTGEPAPTPAPTVFDGWTKTASVRCGTGAWFTDSAGQNVEECKALCSADANCYAIDIHQDWANGYCNLFTQAECTSFSTNGAYDAYVNPAYSATGRVTQMVTPRALLWLSSPTVTAHGSPALRSAPLAPSNLASLRTVLTVATFSAMVGHRTTAIGRSPLP